MPRKLTLTLFAACLLALPAVASGATFTVTNLDGWGPGPAAPSGSLGWAIYNANANGEADLIDFAIDPGLYGPGPWTIIADDQYTLTEPGTVIDGFTQPGASANTVAAPGGLDTVLLITVSGEASTGLNTFGIDTDGTVIRGLNIHSGPLNDVAICFSGGVCTANRVEGCFIGTDATGLVPRPSGWAMWNPPYGAAVFIGGRSSGNVVGSDADDPAARNLLSGEARMGVYRVGFGVLFLGWAGAPNANLVAQNLIGTDPSGLLAVPNGTGVAFIEGGIGNTVTANAIAGNLGHGVSLEAQFAGANSANIFTHNRVGLSPVDASPIPNGGDGFYLGFGSNGNQIGTGDTPDDNLIAHNAGNGVFLDRADDGNQVLSNDLDANGLDGVLLTGCSALVDSNAITANGGWGIRAQVYFGADASPATAADDRVGAPQITNNTIEANAAGGILGIDCEPANGRDLHLDNAIGDNNSQPDVVQRWNGAVELLDSDLNPIGAGAFATTLQDATGATHSADVPDGGLWGPAGFVADDARLWLDLVAYRVETDGTFVELNPYTLTVSGPTVGAGSYTFDGQPGDASLGGQPAGIDTAGQYRYQVAEVITEPDTDGDGVADSVDCAPTDPLYDGVTGPACDADGDGFCDAGISGQVQVGACPSECAGLLCDPSDCDDGDPAVNPAGTEGPPSDASCFDGADNDCDASTDGADPDCQCATNADCDDGLVCNGVEACTGGVCMAGTPIDCSGLDDQCNLGVCDEIAGGCVAQPANEGAACDDGLFCNQGETCQTGTCTGGAAVDCSGLDDQCNAGECDEGADSCVAVPANEGGACDDGDACTMNEACAAGSCTGGAPTDSDGDGYADQACGGDDCDDGDPAVNPGAAEICDNGVDDDCDGATDADDDDCGPVDVCGDGSVTGVEACDDANTADGDGCSATCAVEPGWACRTVSGVSWCGSAPGAGAVVITEIMQNPNCVLDDVGEWFELSNRSGSDLELRGWRLSDDGANAHLISALALPAGGITVLCENADPAANGNVTCDYAYTSYNLANADDEINLADPADTLVDRVAWDGGPAFPDPNGASMSLTPGSDATGNDDGANWCEAPEPIPDGCGDQGSPGAANPACPGACPDADSDGFTDEACGGTDCNDADPDVHPGAAEICDDGVDQDCNGADLTCGCADGDSDGFEDQACGGDDCDDTDADVNPDAAEVCDDGVDNDCDGDTDAADSDCTPVGCGDGVVDAGEGCDDGGLLDGDGCAADCTVEAGWACLDGSQPSLCGSAAAAGDVVITEIMPDPACADDNNGEWFEIENASGRDLVLSGWAIGDQGTDHYTIDALALPSGGIAVLCRNADPDLNGNVTCDAVFVGNLSNSADELFLTDPAGTLVDRVIWDAGATFPDPTGASMSLAPGLDADENDVGANWCAATAAIPGGCGDLGSPGATNPPCGACPDEDEDGFTDQTCGGLDCDDADAAVHPGAEETCDDGIDQDCSGADLQCGCEDTDDDGYPNQACGGTDCDDSAAAINPGADEVCDDEIDNDCDGQTDAADPDCQACADADADGFEDQACGGDDCDDANAQVNPDSAEVCDDELDNDCDGLTDDLDPDCQACPDADGDGFEDQACGGSDCDDADENINPDAAELCDDGVDDDCDGAVDGDDSDCVPCPDLDGDGFTSDQCGGNDCDDSDDTVNPGTAEVCNNGMDDDCDGDVDGDDLDCNKKASGCGCGNRGHAGTAWLALGLLMALWFRRRA